MLWVTLFCFPLMSAIQEICGRLGRITGMGVAANLSKLYPKFVVDFLVLLLCAANIFNLGADISAMAAGMQLVVGGNAAAHMITFATVSLLLLVYVSYHKYVHYLKSLTWALFAYVLTAFVVHIPWRRALWAAVIPSVSLDTDYLMGLVAVLGTTISPYLFFWQTSQEVEEVRASRRALPLKTKPFHALQQFRRIAFDTRVGMAISNLVAFFIILTAAATLHSSGAENRISTAADAAKALQPLAGRFAFLLFALGIVGTGMLATPVLVGSTAYAVSETFGWKASLESKPHQAPQFYYVVTVATILGTCLNLFGFNPIRALFWSALVNALVAVPFMFLLMLISVNPVIVGKFRLPAPLRFAGWLATGVMAGASLGFMFAALRRTLVR
jgi:Mn2+/Fe2+ NRAMP family transporter